MGRPIEIVVLSLVLAAAGDMAVAQELYSAPPPGTETRWASPENRAAVPGAGGHANRGAKGEAFLVVAPGESATLLDAKGAGTIRRIWMSGTIPLNEEQRRLVTIEMFWDGAATPAVSAPVGDFFGVGLGLLVPFESALFSSPEGRSYVATVPMPFRTGARVVIRNGSAAYALVWYDIDYLVVASQPRDALYFHAYWSRAKRTRLGEDFEILPQVRGIGRYLGANIGVIGGAEYRGTWFGEGEVKAYLDGDGPHPTLVGTGTEDYIGSGWGQGTYSHRYQGSLVSDKERDLYAFYRYHVPDAVYFHSRCRITIQQIGNAPTAKVRELVARGAELQPVWVLDTHGEPDVLRLKTAPDPVLLLERTPPLSLDDPAFPSGSTNFYRRDDVSATAYFYLDRPENGLPRPTDLALRTLGLHVIPGR